MNAVKDIEDPIDQTYADLKTDQILIVPGHNPRRFRNKADLNEMRETIRSDGVLQPIMVRPDPSCPDRYLLVMGETRLILSREIGNPTIPSVIRKMTEAEAFRFATIENIQRNDMNEVDEGAAAMRLLLEYNGDKEKVLAKLGWQSKKLEARILLSHAVDVVSQALVDRIISLGHAELLCCLRPEAQAKGLELIVSQKLTVADTKARISQRALQLSNAVFDINDCGPCKHNSDIQSSLFNSGFEKARCLNPECFNQKAKDVFEKRRILLLEDHPVVHLDMDLAKGTYATVSPSEVGEEQFRACRTCQDYGVLMLTSLGSKGQITDNQCFNMSCFKEKVSIHKAAKAIPESRNSDNKRTLNKEAKTLAKGKDVNARANSLPQKAITTHHAAVRRASATAVGADPRLPIALGILAILQDGKITSAELPKKRFSSMHGEGRKDALMHLLSLDADQLRTVLTDVAKQSILESHSTAFSEKEPEKDPFGACAKAIFVHAGLDVAQHFVVDSNYLGIYTKPVIKQMLADSGFAEMYDQGQGKGAFEKLMGETKEDILETVGKSGFDFRGYIPEQLQKQL